MLHRSAIDQLITEATREQTKHREAILRTYDRLGNPHLTSAERFKLEQRLHQATARRLAAEKEVERLYTLRYLTNFQNGPVTWEHGPLAPRYGMYGILIASPDSGDHAMPLTVFPAGGGTDDTLLPYGASARREVVLEVRKRDTVEDARRAVSEWARSTLGVEAKFRDAP